MKNVHEIWIDRNALDTPLAARIRERTTGDALRIVSGREEAESLVAADAGRASADNKRRLFITLARGSFLKTCPGTPGMKCCNLFVLNPIIGCPYDCTYCFLQAYQSDAFITIYANIEDVAGEVKQLVQANMGRLVRICVGELADALALEPVADVAAHLIRLFAQLDHALLELKTKSVEIAPLLSLDHQEKTVLSWTLNIDSIARREEKGAPSPRKRLEAAATAVRAGYSVAFHFDPLVRTRDWKTEYAERVRELFQAVPTESVKWISLGGFRYFPAMKPVIKARSPDTQLFLGEYLPCPDGKYRYFMKHRVELYRHMLGEIRKQAPRVPVYLCMEADYVWRKVFGALPEELPELESIFGEREP